MCCGDGLTSPRAEFSPLFLSASSCVAGISFSLPLQPSPLESAKPDNQAGNDISDEVSNG